MLAIARVNYPSFDLRIFAVLIMILTYVSPVRSTPIPCPGMSRLFQTRIYASEVQAYDGFHVRPSFYREGRRR